MRDLDSGLSPRYFVAEATIWLLGAVLIVARFLGLAPGQSVPVINVTLSNSTRYPLTIAVLLFAATLYLVIEWKQCSEGAKKVGWHRVRFTFSWLWTVVSIWVSYPLLTQDTPYAVVSPVWYLGFFIIGGALGTLIWCMAMASLAIRTPEDSVRLGLPRIPAATWAQFVTWIPVTVIMIAVYFTLLAFVPPAIGRVAVLITVATIIFFVLDGLASITLARDEKGNRIPYLNRIEQFRKAHDFHDYANLLRFMRPKIKKSIDFPLDRSTEDIQQSIRRQYALPISEERGKFLAVLIDEISVRFFAKDGNPENSDVNNCGVTISNSNGMDEKIRVLVTPNDPSISSRELLISTSSFARHFERSLRSASNPEDVKSVIDASLNATLTEVMVKKAIETQPSILHGAVQSGDEAMVTELINCKVDVNEVAVAGWTPLLYACAQGYPQIALLLLDAGAKPDTANALLLTPLMFGARYGNIGICEILLKYGADVDLQDVTGASALIIASSIGNIDVVRMLLNAGADQKIVDFDGKSALDTAYAAGHGHIAMVLKSALKG